MTTSTIDVTQPAFQSALGSAPVRANFTAAAADITALWVQVEDAGVVTLPAQAGHAGEFLTTDGSIASWTANASGTVTSFSFLDANGITGSVTNPTTTPQLSLSLGAIVPTTVNGLTLTALATGFTIAGGTTSKTLTVPLDATVSGTNTGDQTITLSGDISGTGTGAITTTLPTVNSNVGSFTNASMTVNAKGLITAASSGTAPVTSVSGTVNRITSTGGATPVIDISASYIGQSSITTLGTIGTGVWNATSVGVTYGGTGANLSATGGASQVLKQTSVGGAVTVAQLAASDLSNGTTGSGSVVLATSPTLVTPALGTPTALVGTNITGTAAGLTAGTASAVAVGGITGLGTGVATFLATPSSANLKTAVTDETGSGALVFATSPTLVTPVLGAASATSLAFSSTSGIIGTTTNDNAAAGSVGEYISSSVASGSAVALTSATAANVTSISLTAGDWDVEGNVIISPAGGTTVTRCTAAINTASATLPTLPASGASQTLQLTFTTSAVQALVTGKLRLSLASTTTVYLIGRCDFAVSTAGAYGFIGARRVR